MAPLERALALEQVERAAPAVAQDLHLDVARALEPLLEIHRGVAECRGRDALRGLDRIGELLLALDHAHPFPAPAERGLHDHGVAQLPRGARERSSVGAFDARHHRHLRARRQRPRSALVAQRAHLVGGGADEHEPRRIDRGGEVGVLGEKAVAGVDRICAAPLRGPDQCICVQIRRARLGRADEVAFVHHARVERAAVGFGEDRDR